MSYESRAYDRDNTADGFAPDPVVVLVVTGTHDVSRFVHLLAGGAPVIEQYELGNTIRRQVRAHNGGRAALKLLAAHGGPDFTQEGGEPDEGRRDLGLTQQQSTGVDEPAPDPTPVDTHLDHIAGHALTGNPYDQNGGAA
jgi:hypothetical protein